MILLLDVMETLVYDPFKVEVVSFFGMSSLAELYAAKHPTTWREFERGEIDGLHVDGRFIDLDCRSPHARQQARLDAQNPTSSTT